MSVLLALKRLLAPPGYDPDNPDLAASVAAGETPPKLAALGLVNPPAAALTAAVSDSLTVCVPEATSTDVWLACVAGSSS